MLCARVRVCVWCIVRCSVLLLLLCCLRLRERERESVCVCACEWGREKDRALSITLQFTTLHYTTLHNTLHTLHFTALHCITLHYSAFDVLGEGWNLALFASVLSGPLQLHDTTLQDYTTTLHYTSLHYSTFDASLFSPRVCRWWMLNRIQLTARRCKLGSTPGRSMMISI